MFTIICFSSLSLSFLFLLVLFLLFLLFLLVFLLLFLLFPFFLLCYFFLLSSLSSLSLPRAATELNGTRATLLLLLQSQGCSNVNRSDEGYQ